MQELDNTLEDLDASRQALIAKNGSKNSGAMIAWEKAKTEYRASIDKNVERYDLLPSVQPEFTKELSKHIAELYDLRGAFYSIRASLEREILIDDEGSRKAHDRDLIRLEKLLRPQPSIIARHK